MTTFFHSQYFPILYSQHVIVSKVIFQHALKFINMHKKRENVIMNVSVPITWLSNYQYLANIEVHIFLKYFKANPSHLSCCQGF